MTTMMNLLATFKFRVGYHCPGSTKQPSSRRHLQQPYLPVSNRLLSHVVFAKKPLSKKDLLKIMSAGPNTPTRRFTVAMATRAATTTK